MNKVKSMFFNMLDSYNDTRNQALTLRIRYRFRVKHAHSINLLPIPAAILSILMKVISVMNLTAIYLTDETNFLTILAANVLFIALFVLVPLLSNQFVSGSNLSGLGSIVLGAFTAVVTRVLIRPMFQQPKPGKSNPQAGGSSYK